MTFVLAQEENRQFPQRGDVEGFETPPLLKRAVAEERTGDGAVCLALARIAGAHAKADTASDDSRCGDKAELGIAEMQRSSAPAVEPACPPEDLRHGAAGIGAAGENVAVIAVRGGDAIARLEHSHYSRPGRFLPDIEMIMGAKFSRLGEPQHGFLETADGTHCLHETPAQIVGQ